jgi:hypothetical protein
MVNPKNVTDGILKAIEESDWTVLTRNLTPDVAFVHRAWDQPVVGRDEVLTLMQIILVAFPDWKFNAQFKAVQANNVTYTVAVSGTSTQPIDLRGLGRGLDIPTGKTFKLPPVDIVLTVEGLRVCRFEVQAVPGGTFSEIFKQIGLLR